MKQTPERDCEEQIVCFPAGQREDYVRRNPRHAGPRPLGQRQPGLFQGDGQKEHILVHRLEHILSQAKMTEMSNVLQVEERCA